MTPSPSTPRPLPVSTPQLPPELVRTILSLALPPPSFAPDRVQALFLYSSLCKSLKEWAQGELLASPLLRSPRAVERFKKLLGGEVELGRERRERIILVGDQNFEGWDHQRFDIEGLLSLCLNVQELFLQRMVDLDPRDWQARNLRSLHLSNLILTYSTKRLSPLPSLTHLSLLNISFSPNTHPSALLNPTSLPSLRHLLLHHPSPIPSPSPLSSAFLSIAPQLHILFLGPSERSLAPSLPLCTSLIALASSASSLLHFLHFLPHLPPYLRLSIYRSTNKTIDALASNLDWTSGLRALWLPANPRGPAWERLTVGCKENGISVQRGRWMEGVEVWFATFSDEVERSEGERGRAE